MKPHPMKTVPYTTRAGVQIGLLYKRPAPTLDRDGLLLQEALLDQRTARPAPLHARVLGAIWRWC